MVSIITAWRVRWMGLPHSPKTDSDRLIEDNRLSLNRRSLSIIRWLHTAIIQYTSHTLTIFAPGLSVAVYNEHMYSHIQLSLAMFPFPANVRNVVRGGTDTLSTTKVTCVNPLVMHTTRYSNTKQQYPYTYSYSIMSTYTYAYMNGVLQSHCQ